MERISWICQIKTCNLYYMNIGAYGGRDQQASLAQGSVGSRGLDHAALQHGKPIDLGQDATVPQAVVVELGRTSATASTYAPPVARAEATIVLEDGASLKLSASSGQADGGGGPHGASDGVSAQLGLNVDTTVAGGSIVVMDVGKMKASVRVDVVAAAAPGAPANASPVAPVQVAKPGTFSSLDAFAAVQPMQPKALTQADRHDDTEEAANDTRESDHGVDPRWRKYKDVLDSRQSR
jgi:hypothetical protein